MWSIKRMDSLCDVTSSKRVYAKDLCTSGVPFLRSTEIIQKLNGQETPSNPLFISEEHFQKILRTVGAPLKSDLLLTSRGTLGVPYIVKATDRFHFADGNLTWFRRFKDLNSHFLKYFLLSPSGKAELNKCVIGSAQPAYTISALKNIAVPLPPLATQDRIASILSAYDDLIENNTRRIKILEDMAQMLYREWFVNFRFPGHEKVRMVDSELGSIPSSFRVMSLGDVIAFENGRATPLVQDGPFPLYGSNGIIGKTTLAKYENGVLIGRVGAYCGNTMYCRDSFGATDNTIVAKPLSDEMLCIEAIFHLLQSLNLRRYAGGSAQPLMTQTVLKQLQCVTPDEEANRRFHEMLQPIHGLKITLEAKNLNLRTTRDFLLPKLVSGKIPVDAADEGTAELVAQPA